MRVNEILKEVSVVLITIILSMTGFWMMIGKDYITREEAISNTKDIVQAQVEILSNNLNNNKDEHFDFSKVVEQNTLAINELKVQMAALSKTLEFIQKEMVRRHELDKPAVEKNKETLNEKGSS